jgi:PTS system glucitol/sorbitol-specific IIA component
MVEQTVKYELTVTEIGPLVSEFVAEGILVFFEEGAPEELAEFSIIHDHGPLQSPVEPGDTILIGDEPFNVLAVGEVANDNLKNLGHLIVKMNGLTEPEMPGDVCVDNKPVPDIKIGTVVKILSGSS